MSSLVDAVINGQEDLRSDAPSSSGQRQNGRSSSRPRAPPSVSTPGMHSEMGGFPDDELVGLRGLRRNNVPGNREVQRVVDTTAETLGIQFQRFLEEYAHL
jgi:DNA replication licensing factor MCM6